MELVDDCDHADALTPRVIRAFEGPVSAVWAAEMRRVAGRIDSKTRRAGDVMMATLATSLFTSVTEPADGGPRQELLDVVTDLFGLDGASSP